MTVEHVATPRAGAEPGTRKGTADVPPAPILDDPNPGFLRWLLHGVYDFAWYLAILLGSVWWVPRCWRDPAFRRMAAERTLRSRPGFDRLRRDRPRVLIYGVSVGEVKAAQSLVAAFVREHPELEVVVAASTDTGLELARKLYPDHAVVRFPLDVGPLVRRFLRDVDPICTVLLELEIWPNFLRAANRAGIPLAVVNGRITTQSFGSYRLFRHLLPQFNRISLFCVQDEEYAERFQRLGGSRERIVVTGNLKFDGLKVGGVEPPEDLVRLLGGAAGQEVLVAGSTHSPEERWLAETWREHAPGTRLVLVPRHPRRVPEVLSELAAQGFEAQTLTSLRAGEEPDPARPAVVDTIGELEEVYALASLVYVGGSLIPHGGQNMLEPAAQGKPVVYGPNVQNFVQEARLLEGCGAARRVADVSELGPELARLLGDPPARAAMAEAGVAAVLGQRGATELTLSALVERCLSARGAAASGSARAARSPAAPE